MSVGDKGMNLGEKITSPSLERAIQECEKCCGTADLNASDREPPREHPGVVARDNDLIEATNQSQLHKYWEKIKQELAEKNGSALAVEEEQQKGSALLVEEEKASDIEEEKGLDLKESGAGLVVGDPEKLENAKKLIVNDLLNDDETEAETGNSA